MEISTLLPACLIWGYMAFTLRGGDIHIWTLHCFSPIV